MSENCDIIEIFSIYGQFGAIWKPDSGKIVCNTYIVINSNLLQKLKTEIKMFNTALTLKVLFWPKNADFFAKTY